MPPDTAWDCVTIVEIAHGPAKKWSLDIALWTLEEGRSDLTLEVTIIEQEEECIVELDDLHVL